MNEKLNKLYSKSSIEINEAKFVRFSNWLGLNNFWIIVTIIMPENVYLAIKPQEGLILFSILLPIVA